MADYYTQFSFGIPCGKVDHDVAEAWVEEYQALENKMDEEGHEDYDDLFGDLVFKYLREDHIIWVYGEENGNVEGAFKLIQKFLRDFDIEGGVHMSWALTCSKPRLDGFGGGGAGVTKDDVLISNSYDCCPEASEAGVEVLT